MHCHVSLTACPPDSLILACPLPASGAGQRGAAQPSKVLLLRCRALARMLFSGLMSPEHPACHPPCPSFGAVPAARRCRLREAGQVSVPMLRLTALCCAVLCCAACSSMPAADSAAWHCPYMPPPLPLLLTVSPLGVHPNFRRWQCPGYESTLGSVAGVLAEKDQPVRDVWFYSLWGFCCTWAWDRVVLHITSLSHAVTPPPTSCGCCCAAHAVPLTPLHPCPAPPARWCARTSSMRCHPRCGEHQNRR